MFFHHLSLLQLSVFCAPSPVLFLSCQLSSWQLLQKGFCNHTVPSSGNTLSPEGYRLLPWCILRATAMSWRDILSLKVSPGSCAPLPAQEEGFQEAVGMSVLHRTLHSRNQRHVFFPEYCISVVKLGVKTFCRPYRIQREEQIEKCVACRHDQWYTSSLLGFFVWLWKEGMEEKDGSHSRCCDWSTC